MSSSINLITTPDRPQIDKLLAEVYREVAVRILGAASLSNTQLYRPGIVMLYAFY